MFAKTLICSWIGAFGMAGAFGQTYVPFSVGPNTSTYPASINENGEIAGYYTEANTSRGFVRDPGGRITTFDVPGSFGTDAFSIDDEGAITGSYDLNGFHGFVRSPEGTIASFDPLFCAAGSTKPQSINDQGVITGNCFSASLTSTMGWVRFP